MRLAHRTTTVIGPLALLFATAALAQADTGTAAQTATAPADADAGAEAGPKVLYRIVELPTDGVSSRGAGINASGMVAGNVNRPDAQYRHATLWRAGKAVDLGAFGGADANSSVAWDGINDAGMVVGISQTDRDEPRGESWSCAAFFTGAMPSGKTCLGFVWTGGRLQRLRPFAGGANSYATAVNSSGQIVGWAENGVADPSCVSPQVLQFHAAMWTASPQGAQLTELPPLTGDQASAATAINDKGDVVGISGACDVAVGRFTAKHSVLWRNGRPREIPNFGGTSWNTPTAVNGHRQVVGFANHPGPADRRGEINERAFFWDAGVGLVRIGVLAGDTTSEALGINRQGVVVGYSAGANGARAFIWSHGGKLVDLNSRAPGYGGTLIDAHDINDAGQITGAALDATGKRVAFIAIPMAAKE